MKDKIVLEYQILLKLNCRVYIIPIGSYKEVEKLILRYRYRNSKDLIFFEEKKSEDFESYYKATLMKIRNIDVENI